MKSPRQLLCIVPPYSIKGPPLTAAVLLGFARAHGHHGLGFLDLRLGTSNVYAPTYVTTGSAGETYAMDVPDLPLVLHALAQLRRGQAVTWDPQAPVIDGYCRERGIDVGFLCRYLSSLTRYLEVALGRLDELTFIGFSVWTSNFLSTLLACAIVRRRFPDATVVLGGPQVTESAGAAGLALASGLADRIVRGEGEQALVELLAAHGSGRPPRERPSDAVLERPLLRVKDKPLPDFDRMDIAAYQYEERGVSIPFELSRGCTDKCSFCSEWVFWRKFRSDDPLRVVGQLRELVRRHGATDIYFVDSLLNGVPARLETFAEELLRHDLRVSWGGFMRASMDLEKARLLRRAGLRRVFVGVESMSDETLELMNKRRTQADNIRALEAFLGAGLEAVDCGLIPGFPGDTPERFEATLRELVRLRREHPQLSIKIEPFSVTPGQPVFQRLAEFGLERHAWPAATIDLAPELAEITTSLTHRVTGQNQGAARADATRLAHRLVHGDGAPGGHGPFAYSRREDVVDTGVDAWPVIARDGEVAWYAMRGKARTGERRVLLASAAERAALVRALAAVTAPEARREIVGDALEELSAEHIRIGAARACWPSELRAAPAGSVTVDPTLIVRDSGANDVGLIVLRGAGEAGAITCDRALRPLFAAEAPIPVDAWRAEVGVLLAGADPAKIGRYADGLLEMGCFVATGPRAEAGVAARPEGSGELVALRRPAATARP